MSKPTVWKFEWPLRPATDKMSFSMPLGAEVLCAREQRESICIWARVTPDQQIERRDFVLCGTGHEAPDHPAKYIGSAHFFNATLVLHIFEVGRAIQ